MLLILIFDLHTVYGWRLVVTLMLLMLLFLMQSKMRSFGTGFFLIRPRIELVELKQ